MKLFKKIPPVFWKILGIFLVSRLIFAVLGYVVHTGPEKICVGCTVQRQDASNNIWLNIWEKWDSEQYLTIAKHGYSTAIRGTINKTVTYAFFPFYPLLVRYFAFGVPAFMPWVGIIISNICLIASSFLLYILARLDLGEERSLRIIKYLYLLPVAFMFSAVLTESLFLFLMLSAVYASRKRMWFLAGTTGFLMALTRPVGVLIIIPLLLEYLEFIDYKIKRVRKDILFLILPVAGIAAFAIYNHFLTGDYLGFIHMQYLWGRFPRNPVLGLMLNYIFGSRIVVYYILTLTFFIFYSSRFLRFSYWVLFILFFIVPILTGFQSIFRLTVIIFPICFILEEISKDKKADTVLTFFLITLEVFMFFLWQTGSILVV